MSIHLTPHSSLVLLISPLLSSSSRDIYTTSSSSSCCSISTCTGSRGGSVLGSGSGGCIGNIYLYIIYTYNTH